jgi:hypothetical protein
MRALLRKLGGFSCDSMLNCSSQACPACCGAAALPAGDALSLPPFPANAQDSCNCPTGQTYNATTQACSCGPNAAGPDCSCTAGYISDFNDICSLCDVGFTGEYCDASDPSCAYYGVLDADDWGYQGCKPCTGADDCECGPDMYYDVAKEACCERRWRCGAGVRVGHWRCCLICGRAGGMWRRDAAGHQCLHDHSRTGAPLSTFLHMLPARPACLPNHLGDDCSTCAANYTESEFYYCGACVEGYTRMRVSNP